MPMGCMCARYTLIRSASSRVMPLLRRSYSCVVRVDVWLAIVAAFSRVPLLFRYEVMPVARNVWLPIFVPRRIVRSRAYRAVAMPVPSRYACRYTSRV